jgi:hypothetical protein
MALQDTNLIIQCGPIPATFKGTPDEFRVELIRRMKIVSPSGTSFFVVSDIEPTSNQGPWLKGGTQWWVFSEETKRYVPLDISASETIWYFIGNATPSNVDPPLWLKTSQDPTTTDTSYGQPIGWLQWNGAAWVPFNSVPRNGPTSERPASPENYQQYFDTSINVLIHWERGKWRTVAGSPGDIKQVLFEVLDDALTFNPGWVVVGASNQALRGRHLVQATKDSGGSPATNLPTGAGVPSRAAFETWFTSVTAGITDVVPALALWTIAKE